jgi:FAD/FMN-containing dehydrogenase
MPGQDHHEGELRHAELSTGEVGSAVAAVPELKDSLRGELLRPGDAGYDEARTVWNTMVDKRPSMIARCAGVADVIRSVDFARSRDLIVSIRGGGHNVAGNAVCEGGLMIDLSAMRGIRVDPERYTVRVEPGARWNEVDHETQAFGLATPAGTVSQTGVAGLTLGGGLGWLMGKHGLTCDNLLSADIVTADGRFLTTSASEHPDLFWAIRGGGGNFGVVTSFEFRLHPVGPTVLGGMVLYPLPQAKEVLRFYREYARNTPDDLMAFAFLITTPDGIPAAAIGVCWFGPASEGERYLEPLRTLGTPLADLTGQVPYRHIQTMLDDAAPFGMPRYWKSGYYRDLSNEFIDTMLEHTAKKTSPYSAVLLFHMKGAAAKVSPDDTAFVHRGDQWDFDILAQWIDPAEAEQHIEWARRFWDAVEPLSNGVYVNHLDSDDSANRVRAAYGANYDRLVAVKKKYDPTNFFRLNKNIAPDR